MKFYNFFLLIFVFSWSSVASAAFSSNIAVTTDYVWRGQTQTANGPAVQGGMDYEHSSGFSLGTWMSNVSGLGAEIDYYAKYSHAFNENMSASIGGVYYYYTKADLDTLEANLAFTFWMATLSINFIDEYFKVNSNSWYFNLSGSCDLVKKLGLGFTVALGYTTFGNEALVGSTDYLDYKVSLDHNLDKNTVSLFYTDTDRDTTDGVTKTKTDDQVIGVMLSRQFSM